MGNRTYTTGVAVGLVVVALAAGSGCSVLETAGQKSLTLAPAELATGGLEPAAEAGKPVTARLAEEGWGEPVAISDKKSVRSALSGQEAVVYVEPWWGPGARPEPGRYWLVKIDYQDTAKQPVVLAVFGNLARYNGRTELHRFGGLGDGQWKTAEIPLPWDMVMARPESGLVDLAIHSAAGDVPIGQIRIVPLGKAQLAKAAERYNAETREWIARVQAAKRNEPRNEFAEPQVPAGSAVAAAAPVVPFVRSYLQPVYPYSAPQETEVNVPIEARMAVNEYEPAAFGVYANGQDLTNVRVRIAPLRHESKAGKPLAVEVMTAEYALVPNSPRRAAQTQAAQPQKAYAICPQRLWPAYPAKIHKGESGWFWLTFRSDPAANQPGMYYGRAVIEADQGSAHVDVQVRVMPIHLLAMNETDLLMGGCVTGLLPRHEMVEMLEHNHNQVNLWLHGVAPKIIAKGTDDFDLDFTLMDDFMAQMKAAGLRANVYFLGGDPYGFPMTFTLQRELAKQVLGMTNEQYAERMSRDKDNIPAEIVPLYRKWVATFCAHAKEAGWPEQILTPFDEPAKWVQTPGRKNSDDPKVIGTGPWIRPQFEQACKLIREGAPDCRIYGSIHHAEPGIVFAKDIDVFCTNAIGEDQQLGEKVRQAGKVFWQYSGTGDGLPDRTRFSFGFYFGGYNSRGSLCWAYNWGSRFDTTEGSNWMYAWYTPLDVIAAPSYEAMREAWDDRRYVETLKKVAKEKNVDVAPFLAEIAEAGQNLRGRGGRDTVTDFWEQSKRVEAMDELRAKVADKILAVTGGAGNLRIQVKSGGLVSSLKAKIAGG